MLYQPGSQQGMKTDKHFLQHLPSRQISKVMIHGIKYNLAKYPSLGLEFTVVIYGRGSTVFHPGIDQ